MANPNPNKRWQNNGGSSSTPVAAARVVDHIDAATIADMTPTEAAGFKNAIHLIAHMLMNVEPSSSTAAARPAARQPGRPATPIYPTA